MSYKCDKCGTSYNYFYELGSHKCLANIRKRKIRSPSPDEFDSIKKSVIDTK